MIRIDLEFLNDWRRLAEGIEGRMETLIDDSLEHIQQHVVTAMELPKSGREYAGHIASAPGDAPATDTGDLIDSAAIERDGMEGAITYTSDHALHMEFGAPNASVAARPFLAPAVAAEQPAFEQRLAGIIQ